MRFTRFHLVGVLLALAVVLLIVGTKSNSRPPAPDCSVKTATDDWPGTSMLCYVSASAGATLTLPTGGTLEVPPGALEGDTYIYFASKEEIHSGVYVHVLEPTGLPLKKPARVTLPIVREALAPGEVIDDGTMAVYFDGMEQPIPVTVDMEHGFIRYEITKF